ncbi:polysaccharide deacetylase family protein [Thiohalorhabdus sp.]|uniref:polysaccharide deacetylase family protein n=1 Tax=Thiohalorhabdus sp. TaxID=3094134 RepID=UPI002FC30F30
MNPDRIRAVGAGGAGAASSPRPNRFRLMPVSPAPLLWGLTALAAVAVAAGVAILPATPAAAVDHAVILEYHHVGTDTPPSTSVTPETFEAHLGYLAEHDYHVWPLPRLLKRLEAGRSLPERTVALTFDDAYASVYTEAYPRLAERGWPFTVFVSTDYIDKGYAGFMEWDQLRELADNGAAIGNHSRSHPHLARPRRGDSRSAWLERVRAEIRQAQDRLAAETEDPVRIFAYPFGEFSAPVREMVADLGFYGVGQQSGAVGPTSDLTAAPRFPLSGTTDMVAFATKVRSRALPAEVLAPGDGVLEPDADKPALRLRIPAGPYRLEALACYASGQGRIEVEWRDRDAGKVMVRPQKALAPGRTKYNCTAPSSETNGVFYWYSFLWMKPNPDGSWYAD